MAIRSTSASWKEKYVASVDNMIPVVKINYFNFSLSLQLPLLSLSEFEMRFLMIRVQYGSNT